MPGAVRKIPVRSVYGEETSIQVFEEEQVSETEDEAPDNPQQSDPVEELDTNPTENDEIEDDNEESDDGIDKLQEDIVEKEEEKVEKKKEKKKDRKSSRRQKKSVVDMFNVSQPEPQSASPLREEDDDSDEAPKMFVDAGEEECTGEQDTQKRKKSWKSFTDGMKKYKAVMKKKLSRPKKDKNGVEEISIKPRRTLHSNEADLCWGEEEPVKPEKVQKKTKKSKTSVTKFENNNRTGSAGSGSSDDAVIELNDVEDGIETIYDAEDDDIEVLS